MGTRRTGRVIAFQSLYRFDITGDSIEDLVDFSWIDEERRVQLKPESIDFAKLLIIGTVENIETIDAAIKEHLVHWDFSRLAKVDLAVLRLSVYCLLYQTNIPRTVVINEAVDIAKKYGSKDSYRFVNGVLDQLSA
jgi:N utilization substance protein B